MQLVCAWCKNDMGMTGDSADRRISHGICDSCRFHLQASSEGIPLQRFLDSLDVPVMLVDHDMRVVYVNLSAQKLLKKPPAAIEHHLGGNVFECENSFQPGGCGKTANCPACTLRNAVTRCYESGRAEDGVVATLKQRTADGPVDLVLRISTKRVNDHVLLRIDGIG